MFIISLGLLHSLFALKSHNFGRKLTNTIASVVSSALLVNGMIPTSATAADLQQYRNDKFQTSLGFPSDWETKFGTLSGQRSIVAFTDPNDQDTSASIVFSPIPADYTKLSSFGGKDSLRVSLLPSGEGVSTKVVDEKVKGESYYIEYVVSAPDAPTRHVQSVFALRPQESVIGLTIQTKEETYDKYKSLLGEILPTFHVDI